MPCPCSKNKTVVTSNMVEAQLAANGSDPLMAAALPRYQVTWPDGTADTYTSYLDALRATRRANAGHIDPIR